MKLITGKHSGFCFGVQRAIKTAESLSGENNYVLGEIIHNEQVIEKLKNSGIRTINSIDGQNLGDKDTLLIRTHGEPKSTFEKAKKLGVKIIDCTCPFVSEIQKIVERHYKQGYFIVIIGDASHPEVQGINGWCENTALITEDVKDLLEISADKICIVVQTTYSEEKFNGIIKNFNYVPLKKVAIFKTICYTTTKRQKEAEVLSRLADAVIVIGGANSNNTQKLFDICKGNCENTFRIINPKSFEYEKIKNFYKVGVVFGASTPIEQFQEVISNMEKVTEEIITTETVEATAEAETVNQTTAEEVAPVAEVKAEAIEAPVKSEMEAAFDKIKQSKDWKIGQIVVAKISLVKDNGIVLSVKNTKADYFEVPNEELLSENKADYVEDADIRVMVIGKNPIKFSEKAMAKVMAEEAELEDVKNGKIFEATIEATNKGGLIAKYGRFPVFIPASQIRIGFVKDLDKYVGKTLRLKAEKVDGRGSRCQIIASQRVILQDEKDARDAIKAEKEAEFFASIQEGDVVLGTPVRFAKFGAFIDVNGFDCLAHISDLSWTGCNECGDVLEIGKQYEFKILKIDEEGKRVSVGYKQLQPKPWDTILDRYNVGDTVKGKVVRIVSFGAFVEIEKGIDGLVHVSQISNKWLENPVTALQVGQEVDAKILDINPEKEKMTLSIKALLEAEAPVEATESDDEGRKAKGKKRGSKKADISEDAELHEWKDTDQGGASIADLIKNN